MMRPKPRSRMPSMTGRRHVEQRVQVGVDDGVPLVRRHLVEHAVLGDAGVVDENVDRAEVLLDLRESGGAGVVVGDVPLEDVNARSPP